MAYRDLMNEFGNPSPSAWLEMQTQVAKDLGIPLEQAIGEPWQPTPHEDQALFESSKRVVDAYDHYLFTHFTADERQMNLAALMVELSTTG